MNDLLEKIIQEFKTSRKIIREGSEVVPRFRIFAPDGEHVVVVQLSEDLEDRLQRLNTIRLFNLWKAATAFVVSSELVEPQVIMTVAVTRSERFGAIQRIKRNPVRFGRIKRLSPDELDETITSLLPPKSLEISLEDIEFVRRAFEESKIPGVTWRGPGA